MSLVCAIKEENRVRFASDSITTTQYVKRSSEIIYGKLFAKKCASFDMICGVVGAPRVGQLIKYAYKPPKVNKKSMMQYMIEDFVPGLINCFEDHNSLENKDGRSYMPGGSRVLIGIENQLYDLDCAFQISMPDDKFNASGAGQEFALGSLHSTEGLDTDERLELAIGAAARFSPWVLPPMVFASTDDFDQLEDEAEHVN